MGDDHDVVSGDPFTLLAHKIDSGALRMSVIGIGRVGLPLALSFADNGVEIVGVDRDPSHVELVNDGVVPFLEPGAEPLLKEALDLGTFSATTEACPMPPPPEDVSAFSAAGLRAGDLRPAINRRRNEPTHRQTTAPTRPRQPRAARV